MEIISIEQLMKDKLAECDMWLADKDIAIDELAKAKEVLARAEAKVAEYTEENIIAVEKYRDDLKARLGIVDEVAEEVAEVEIVKEEVPVPIQEAPHTIIQEQTDEIAEMPILAR